MGNEIVLCEQTKRNQVEEVAPTFQSLLLNSSIQFLQREIEGVDANKSTIHLSSPTSRTTHPYSALIIATGADINLSATPYAQPFYTVEDCFELRRTLRRSFPHRSFPRSFSIDGNVVLLFFRKTRRPMRPMRLRVLDADLRA